MRYFSDGKLQGGGGGGGGGADLTPEQQLVFDHFKFNPDTERLEADRPVTTVLNSFFLGNQHKITSGGRQVFFQNLSTGINFFPPWGGVKDQSIVANQDATGLLPITSREYGLTLESLEPSAPDVSGVIDFELVVPATNNMALFAAEIVVEETLIATDFIFVDVWGGTDMTGIKIYAQIFTNKTATIGTTLRLDSTHSLDVLTGDTMFMKFFKASSRSGPKTPLSVRRSLTTPTNPYAKFFFRTFINEPLANKKYVMQTLLGESIGDLFTGEVEFHTDLPLASTAPGEVWRVRKRTANYFTLGMTSRFLAGYYESDGTNWLIRPNAALPTFNIGAGFDDTWKTTNYRQFTPDNIVKIVRMSVHGLNENPDSLGMGMRALGSTTTATGNTTMGTDTGGALTSGSDNLFFGFESGKIATSANFNVGMGQATFIALTTGSNNVAIGEDAMKSITIANRSVAVGGGSLKANTSGNMTALGFGALGQNTSGLRNTGLGNEAGDANLTGNDNTSVGYKALQFAKSSGNTAVGSNSMGLGIATGNDNVAVGANTLLNLTLGTDNVAIGADAMLNSTIAKSNVAIGRSALLTTIAGDFNIAIGDNALSLATGGDNVAVGFEALKTLGAGTGNVAVGVAALTSATASANTAIGFQSMFTNTIGNENTAVGFSSLELNVGGIGNTALGHNALKGNISNRNTAIGARAMSLGQVSAVGCVAIGHNALRDIGGGSRNIAIGEDALLVATIGNFNVAIGGLALNATTTGADNVAIGVDVGAILTTGSRNILIGQGVDVPLAITDDYLNIGDRILGDMSIGSMAFFDGTRNRIQTDQVKVLLTSPNGLHTFQIDDTGGFLDGVPLAANAPSALQLETLFQTSTHTADFGTVDPADNIVQVTGIPTFTAIEAGIYEFNISSRIFNLATGSSSDSYYIGLFVDGVKDVLIQGRYIGIGVSSNRVNVYATITRTLAAGQTVDFGFSHGAADTSSSVDLMKVICKQLATTSLAIGEATTLVGPPSSIDNRVVLFSGTTGEILKEALVTINGGAITGVTLLVVDSMTMNGSTLTGLTLLNGFTALGSGNPGIKIKQLTGTASSSEGGSSDLTHGLTMSKILGIQVLVGSTAGTNRMGPGFTTSAGFEYSVFMDSSRIRVVNSATNSENILSGGIVVLITYKA